ncbi:MAG: hypothetical protein WDZ82_01215 [Candidatus Paceibacterota bacterium]
MNNPFESPDVNLSKGQQENSQSNEGAEEGAESREQVKEEVSLRLVGEYDERAKNQQTEMEQNPTLRLRGAEQDVEAVCDMVACQAEVDHGVMRQILEELQAENDAKDTNQIDFLYEVVAAKFEETLRRREAFAEMLADVQHQFPALADELRKRFSDIDAMYTRSEEAFEKSNVTTNKKAA